MRQYSSHTSKRALFGVEFVANLGYTGKSFTMLLFKCTLFNIHVGKTTQLADNKAEIGLVPLTYLWSCVLSPSMAYVSSSYAVLCIVLFRFIADNLKYTL